MAITGIFEADFSKFQTAVEQANVSLRGFQTNGEKVESQLTRVGNSLTGVKIIQQATLMAKAVEDVGGASKLTADELARVQAIAQQAVDKFTALGQTAPDVVQKLADGGKSWEQSFTGVGVSLSVVQTGLEAIVGAATAAAAAFSGLLIYTVSLGNKIYEMSLRTGASVEDLSKLRYVASQTGIDFDSFSTTLFKMEKSLGATGSAADKTQETLGRLGLNMQTLKNENPADAFNQIVDGLEHFKNKSDQAAIGAQLFGRGWKEMAGLASVSIKGLEQDAEDLGVVMTTRTASAAHAAEAGFERLTLQLEGTATKIGSAFLPAIIGLETDLGTLLKDAIDGVNASFGKMGGSGGFIATVVKAMGTGNEAIAAQIKVYEYLRDALIATVRYGIEPVVTAFSALMQIWDEGKILVDLAVLGYEKLAYGLETVLLWTEKLAHIGSPFDKTVTDDINATNFAMSQLGDKIEKDTVNIVNLRQGQQDWAQSGIEANRKIEASLTSLGKTHVDVEGIIAKFGKESKDAYGGVSDEVDIVSDKMTDKFDKSLEELTFKIDDANFHAVSMTEKVKLFGAAAAKAAEEAKVFGIDVDASLQVVADAFNRIELGKLLAKMFAEARAEGAKYLATVKAQFVEVRKSVASSLTDLSKADDSGKADTLDDQLAKQQTYFDKQRAALQDHVNANTSANDAIRNDYFYSLALIDAAEERSAQKATDVWNENSRQMEKFANTISNVFTRSIEGVPALLTNIFTGNNITKAISDFTSRLGADLGGSLLSAGGALNGLANKIGSGLTKVLGSSIGGSLAAIIPGIGSAIGALAGPLISSVGSLFNKLFGSAGRDAVVNFANSLGGFDALHVKLNALGADGERLWINLTQGVGNNNPTAAKAAIDAINAALSGQDAYLSRLPGEMQKYGLSWEQAGKQAEQSHLDDIAKGLIQDFADLADAGFDVSTVTKSMSDSVDTYIHEALRTGTEVPAAMKPLLQKMIDLGTLTDDAGNTITDLSASGITFSETLTEGFQSVVKAINDMVKALTGGGPSSLYGALETIGNKTVSPKIKPIYDDSGLPPGYQTGTPGTFNSGNATYASPSAASSTSNFNVSVVSTLDGKVVSDSVGRRVLTVGT
jgi:hypothetical protein